MIDLLQLENDVAELAAQHYYDSQYYALFAERLPKLIVEVRKLRSDQQRLITFLKNERYYPCCGKGGCPVPESTQIPQKHPDDGCRTEAEVCWTEFLKKSE